MDKLFLVEGIPGSGKTTFARLLAERFSQQREKACVYTEGDLHPTDMAWCALLTNEEYDEVCKKYPQKKAEFDVNSTSWRNYRIVAYTKVSELDGEAFSYFESKEVYDGRVDGELFRDVHLSRWESFGKSASGITVFECAFLQNAVNELLLFHNADETVLTEYLTVLAGAVKRLQPTIVYLDVDVEKSLDNAASERVDENKNRVWESRVAEYISQSPYGIKHGLVGVTGMHKYFANRKTLELKILPELPLDKKIVKIDFENRAQ